MDKKRILICFQHSLSQVKITLQAQNTGVFVGKNQNLFVTIPDYELATTVGLTADKIKEGETILGVVGLLKKELILLTPRPQQVILLLERLLMLMELKLLELILVLSLLLMLFIQDK